MPAADRDAPVDATRRHLLGAAMAGIACVGAANWSVATPRPQRGVEIVGAPSNLGLRPLRPGHVPGAWRTPQVLRTHGLAHRLGAADRGDVPAPAYTPVRDPATGYRNGAGLVAYTPLLAQQIGAVLDGGRLALVLGGDCSVLLGSALALKRRGRYGLLFVDGHTDFYFPPHAQTSTAAGTDLALATGHGPAALVDIEARAPYVREADAVVFGYRDYGAPDVVDTERFLRAAFARYPLERVRSLGTSAAMRDALRTLERPDLDGFWIHVDVDVLDPGIMPAVDSFDPGGMQFAELEDALAIALASSRVVGMELTIYDPDLDADGKLAERLIAILERAFARAGLIDVRKPATG
ncbi:arginase family protein [Dokdonella soli]